MLCLNSEFSSGAHTARLQPKQKQEAAKGTNVAPFMAHTPTD